jgi:RecA/RadA recombinase
MRWVNRTRVKIVKNKMAPPFKQAEFDILYGTGISREGSLIDFGVEHDIVKRSGAWFTYDGDQLGQGKENARKYLVENPDIAQSIEDKILTALGVAQIEGANVGDEAPAEEASVESLEDKRAERSA